ncbi:hypothetical protein MHBO_000616 [Bonamia ostreae]|uniref:Uncharacterized protein n=1 Tax=Bonamia ostreae TaxID=126728 RepID=A0ABV2AGA2_9EUKA
MNDEVVGKIKTFSSIATNFESANVLVDNFPVSVKVPKGSQNARINKAVGGGGSFFFSVYNLSHYSNAKFDFWFCVNNTETYNDLFPQRNIFEKELILPLCGFFWGFENKTVLAMNLKKFHF